MPGTFYYSKLKKHSLVCHLTIRAYGRDGEERDVEGVMEEARGREEVGNVMLEVVGEEEQERERGANMDWSSRSDMSTWVSRSGTGRGWRWWTSWPGWW